MLFLYRLTVKQIYLKRPVNVFFYSLNVGNAFIVWNAEYTSHSFITKKYAGIYIITEFIKKKNIKQTF